MRSVEPDKPEYKLWLHELRASRRRRGAGAGDDAGQRKPAAEPVERVVGAHLAPGRRRGAPADAASRPRAAAARNLVHGADYRAGARLAARGGDVEARVAKDR